MRLLWQILTRILISILVEVLITKNASKWRKKEYDEKRAASQEKQVYLPKMLTKQVNVLMTFVVVVGILLVIFPQICEWLEFDYKTALLVWWIPLTLDLIIYVPVLVKFEYDQEKFEYTNAFGFTRVFRYEDVVKVIETKCFVRIITKNKQIRFGKGLCGAESFIDHLKERAIATGFKVVKL